MKRREVEDSVCSLLFSLSLLKYVLHLIRGLFGFGLLLPDLVLSAALCPRNP